MLNINRICIYIIMFGLILLVPSIVFVTFVDELCAMALLGTALADCIFNRTWRRYSLLWGIVAVITFYAIYSLTTKAYNIPAYIFMDLLIEVKPFIPFAVILVLRPEMTSEDRRIIKRICVANSVITTIVFLCGPQVMKFMFVNPSFASQVLFVSAIYYLYCSIDRDTGKVPRTSLRTALLMLTIGLASLKAKYYGYYIIGLYLLTFYKPGSFRHIRFKHMVGVGLLGLVILAATWSKIEYYFLTGSGTDFDPEIIETFARPVLYATGGLILMDHIPFGSGLASFATATSSMNYSGLYHEYGIDKVHGISQNSEYSFICDSFYPSLAQFGFVGVVLFIWFWVYVYGYLRVMIRHDAALYKYKFIIGSLIIAFILIESVAATTFTHNSGFLVMFLLGMVCADGRVIKRDSVADTLPRKSVAALRKI